MEKYIALQYAHQGCCDIRELCFYKITLYTESEIELFEYINWNQMSTDFIEESLEKYCNFYIVNKNLIQLENIKEKLIIDNICKYSKVSDYLLVSLFYKMLYTYDPLNYFIFTDEMPYYCECGADPKSSEDSCNCYFLDTVKKVIHNFKLEKIEDPKIYNYIFTIIPKI